MKKLFTLIAAVLFAGSMMATEVEVVIYASSGDTYAKAHDWQNATQYDQVILDENISANRIGTGNNGKYYSDWRFYTNGSDNGSFSIDVAEGFELQSVKLEFTTMNSGALFCGASEVINGNEFALSGNKAVFQCKNTNDASNGQVRLTGIIVKYDVAGSGPGPGPDPEPEDPKIQFAGELTSWSPVDFTLAADKKTATFTKNIAEGEHQFKIIVNGDWRSNAQSFDRDNASAAGITGNESTNMKLIADATGDYTFTWTIATNALEINFPAKEGPGPEPQPEDPKVQFAGEITGWSGEAFTLAADKKTATFTKNIAEGDHEFKIIVGDNDWRSNGWTYHREFTHADGITMNDGANMKLQADVTGDYTFTWTFETNSIDIVFPAKDPDPQPVDKSGYYIVGNHTDWQIEADYKFEANPAQEGEYMTKMFLTPEYLIKVVYTEDGENIKTWFPEGEGNAYGEHGEITESNGYTIYFRPNKDGGEDWFYGCIYIVPDKEEGIEDLNASEKAVKVIRNGQIFIIKGNKTFNVLGAQMD